MTLNIYNKNEINSTVVVLLVVVNRGSFIGHLNGNQAGNALKRQQANTFTFWEAK